MANDIACKLCRDAAGKPDRSKSRKCDEPGCGRHFCRHMGKSLGDDKDRCGPCNLKAGKAAKAKKPDAPPADEAVKS
jgi:hypothetical protein